MTTGSSRNSVSKMRNKLNKSMDRENGQCGEETPSAFFLVQSNSMMKKKRLQSLVFQHQGQHELELLVPSKKRARFRDKFGTNAMKTVYSLHKHPNPIQFKHPSIRYPPLYLA